jgi:hypothetical protein
VVHLSQLELSRAASREAGKVHTINVQAQQNGGSSSKEMAGGANYQTTSATPVVVAASSPGTQATGSSSVQKQAAPAGKVRQQEPDREFEFANGSPSFPADPTTNKQPKYARSSNCVISSKYTILSFLPLNLFEQFCNLANL